MGEKAAFKRVKAERGTVIREADFVNLSSHPAICRFFGIYTSKIHKCNFLVMEYMEHG